MAATPSSCFRVLVLNFGLSLFLLFGGLDFKREAALASTIDSEAAIYIDANNSLNIEPPVGGIVKIVGFAELEATKAELSATKQQLSQAMASIASLQAALNPISASSGPFLIAFDGIFDNEATCFHSGNILLPFADFGFSYKWFPIKPNPGFAVASAVVLAGDYVVVAGGYSSCNPSVETSAVYLFSLSSKTWKRFLLDLSTPRVEFSGAYFPSSNSVVLCGGRNSSTASNSMRSCEVLNPIAGSTLTFPSMSQARSSHSSVLYMNNLLVMGGVNLTVRLSSCELYNTTSNTWSSFPSLQFARNSFGAAVMGSKIYIIGGVLTVGATVISEICTLSGCTILNEVVVNAGPCNLVPFGSRMIASFFQNFQTEFRVIDPTTTMWDDETIPPIFSSTTLKSSMVSIVGQ